MTVYGCVEALAAVTMYVAGVEKLCATKLAGLTDVQQSDYEKWVREGDRDVKFSTIKVTMIRPERVNVDQDAIIVSKIKKGNK